MLIVLMACVTGATFPRMYADDVCEWIEACTVETCDDERRDTIEDGIRDEVGTYDFDPVQARACLDEIETATEERDCGNLLRACDGM